MLNQKYMCGVLRGGDPGGGSVMVAIAVVIVLSSGVPVVQHILLNCLTSNVKRIRVINPTFSVL